LATALTRAFKTDAHFVQYVSPIGRRMNGESLGTGHVMRSDVIVFDVDCPDTHGTSDEVPSTWRAENRERVLALRAAHPDCAFYETRGGSRIVYMQPLPTEIVTADDATTWKQDYAVMVAYLGRVFGIDADYACADWTRFFRCPRATRKPGGAPESRAVAGDPHNVGRFWAEPNEDDLATAKAKLKNAFDPPKLVLPASGVTSICDGYGILFHALRARGDVFREYKRGTFLIRCPNEAQHSSGKTGDTSTMLYLPSPGQVMGFVKCLHGHCVGLNARDWVRMFSESELDDARAAAGLEQRRRA
ncbi:MAG: hypothetical protein V4637_11225, partial [Pseudomonadota bacterium]